MNNKMEVARVIDASDRIQSDFDTLICLAAQLKLERERCQQLEHENARQAMQIRENAHKVLFTESIASSNISIPIYVLAKMLRDNGIKMNTRKIFRWMRENGYLVAQRSDSYNMPTELSFDMGLFDIKTTTITHTDRSITIKTTPLVTGKGVVYFLTKFLEARLPEAR